MNHELKIERWAEKEIRRNMNHLIVDDGNRLLVFGHYELSVSALGCLVHERDTVVHQFHNKKTAISWCVADKFKKYQLANNILILDRKMQLLSADIYCRKTLGDRGRTESFYETVNVKMQPKIMRYQSVTSELENCINQTKYLQIRGFSNETK